MVVIRNLVLPAATAVSAVILPLLPASSVRADVEIVTSVTVTGDQTSGSSAGAGVSDHQGDAVRLPKNQSAVYTTFFKGNKARREIKNSSTVVLYDKSADKVYTIDTEARKYFSVSFKEAAANGSALPPPIADTMNLLTSVDLDDAATSADGNRVIAGRSSQKYTLFGSVSSGPKSADTPGFVPASGAFSHRSNSEYSGGNGDSPDSTPMPRLGRSTLNGSLWIADADSVIGKGAKDEKDLSISLLQMDLPFGSPVLKPLANELHKKHALPIASRVTLREYAWSSGENPGSGGLRDADRSGDLTISMEVESIDDRVSLADSLFELPPGLTRIDPPAPISPLPRQ